MHKQNHMEIIYDLVLLNYIQILYKVHTTGSWDLDCIGENI